MSEELLDREATDDPGADVDASVPRRPRWIAPVGIAVGVLVVVALVILHLIGALGPGAH
jgi:hypothetical protein